jgi:hypothetical protein
MSAKSARPSQTHSKPVIPPWKRSTYIMVVQGTKMDPARGTTHDCGKARAQIVGLTRYQIRMPARGPRKTKIVKIQHMVLTSE